MTDHMVDTGDAIGRYRDLIVSAFNPAAIDQLYGDLFGVRLAHEVNGQTDLKDLIQQLLYSCAHQGAHLPRLLARIVRVRAGRKDVVAKLTPDLGLAPVVELAELLVRRGCPEALRDEVACGFETPSAHRTKYHARGREAWIDVLVWLEELADGGQDRPLLLDYLERLERAWRSVNAAGAAALAAVLDDHRTSRGIAARADEDAGPRDRRRAQATADEDAAPRRCALPIALLPTKHGAVIGTEAGEWFEIGDGDALVALPPTGPFAVAIVDPSGTVTVACWDESIQQLRGRSWEPRRVAEPAIALAVTERGLIVGDAAGNLTLVPPGARLRGEQLAAGAPVLELGVAGVSLVMIDAHGRLAVTAWPLRGDGALVALDTDALGRPFALCPGARAATLIAIGERGIGVVDGARLTDVVEARGVRAVAAFRGHDRACVVADGGAAWLVDAQLARVAPIRIPGGGAGIEGTAAGLDGSLLAWTADGGLYAIGPDGAVRRLAEGDIVLAMPDCDDREDPSAHIAVHWTADAGPRVSRGSAAWI